MTLDSVFRIASMTKAITGTAAMQLVEKGEIGLEQPMGDVLPVIKDVKVLEGFDANGTPRVRDPKTPITLRHHLVRLRSDLARYTEVAGLSSILSRKDDAWRLPLTC
jgi:methyl acetate hydrolase